MPAILFLDGIKSTDFVFYLLLNIIIIEQDIFFFVSELRRMLNSKKKSYTKRMKALAKRLRLHPSPLPQVERKEN